MYLLDVWMNGCRFLLELMPKGDTGVDGFGAEFFVCDDMTEAMLKQSYKR